MQLRVYEKGRDPNRVPTMYNKTLGKACRFPRREFITISKLLVSSRKYLESPSLPVLQRHPPRHNSEGPCTLVHAGIACSKQLLCIVSEDVTAIQCASSASDALCILLSLH